MFLRPFSFDGIHAFLHKKAVVYASCTLGTSLMHSVFQFYYVKIYLDYYRLPEHWFHIGQTIYMIWNAINDPLLGYCQDHCKSKLVQSRRHTILYGAPLWSCAFLLPWFSVTPLQDHPWLCASHMVFALCAYDTMFTHVLLAHGCVLAEMAETHEERVTFFSYQAMAGLLGSSSVLFCEAFSDHLSSFRAFQVSCVIIAVFAYFFVRFTGKNAITKYDLISVETPSSASGFNASSAKGTALVSSDRSTEYSVLQLTWQILKRWNFFWFVLVNFLSEFHLNYVANMSRITSEMLVAPQISTAAWNIYCGAIMILPRAVQIVAAPILPKIGYHKTYNIVFILTITVSGLMYLCGFNTWLFIAFTLVDSVLAGASTSLMGLPLSDVIEEDCRYYKRRHPVSSMVFGTNALITKPAISLAPMLAVTILNRHGYQDYQSSLLSDDDTQNLYNVVFNLSCCLPLLVCVVQLGCWTFYTIKNPHINNSSNK